MLQIPDVSVTNFTSDWRNGHVLSELMRALKYSSLPRDRTSDPLLLVKLCIEQAGLILICDWFLFFIIADHEITRDFVHRQGDGRASAAVG